MIKVIKPNLRGQIVIPARTREELVEGNQFVIASDDESYILKANPLSEKEKEELEFIQRTEEAMKRIKAGDGTEMDFDDFIEEMKKW